MADTLDSFDLLVVGAGPGGIAAATTAAESGARVILVDEGFAPGGQIHRRLPHDPPPPRARPWIERLERSRALVRSMSTVTDVRKTGHRSFAAQLSTPEGTQRVSASAVVLACGARELFLPFPGWELPGVLGAGGLQAMVKCGARVDGKRIVVAGSGPLLWPVAATLESRGAHVVAVVEQSPAAAIAAFAAQTALFWPEKLLDGIRYRSASRGARFLSGAYVARAEGFDRISRVVIARRGREFLELECDHLAIGYGLLPNTETAELLGCETSPDPSVGGRRVKVGDVQETSVGGVFAVGEMCGIAGADAALIEGTIAALAALDHGRVLRRLMPSFGAQRARARRFGRLIARTFGPSPDVRRLAASAAFVCRCEDVAPESIGADRSAREVKLATRCGMGPCQARICGPAREMCGLAIGSDSVRLPLKPATFGEFI